MTCECDHLPSVLNLETYPHGLTGQLILIDRAAWLTLQKCENCDQLWQLDNIDRLQTNLAIKLDKNVEWRDFKDKPARYQYLIESRGGLSEKICIMEGCSQKALMSLAHCPFHAFDYLGLRE
jgi:hypothetical protein